MDSFSKACHLVPLKGLPTAMETAEVRFNCVFRNFGLPEGIASDRGPQFFSQVLEVFLLAPRSDRKSIFWIPPTEQWSNGKKDPGDRALRP